MTARTTPAAPAVPDLIERTSRQLDRTGQKPLHEQIADAVREEIRLGRLKPGEALPKEPDFAQSLGVSRQTVNHALGTLTEEGLLRRRRGIGTFVVGPEIEQRLDHLYSFIRTVNAQRRTPASHVLGCAPVHDGDAAAALTGDAESPVWRIGRLRFVDDEPFVLEDLFLSVEIGERISCDRLAAGEPVYDLIREELGSSVDRANETVQVTTLTENEAALLGLPPGAPAFRVIRLGYRRSQLIELRRSLVRGDRYQLVVELEAAQLHEAPAKAGMAHSTEGALAGDETSDVTST